MLSFVLFLIYHLNAQGNEPITWKNCTGGTCSTQKGFITIDKAWRSDDGTGTVDLAVNAGATVSGDSVSQKFMYGTSCCGSRLYLLDSTENAYVKFKLINAELTYDVELSTVPCGMNAAIYTAEMPAAGTGPGAKYGGGYCDANYVDGEGCSEMDIGEANVAANVYTSHGCAQIGHAPKGEISCDSEGVGSNPYHEWDGGSHSFYGSGSTFTIDSSKKFTVVTQFITGSSGSSSLTEIKRIFIQGGKQSPQPNSITTKLADISKSFAQGHVLVFALWAQEYGDMSWLDAWDNGPCDSTKETQSYFKEHNANATVTYSNIRYGDLNSTF